MPYIPFDPSSGLGSPRSESLGIGVHDQILVCLSDVPCFHRFLVVRAAKYPRVGRVSNVK